MFLSIIIPIFNVEQYIEKCLISIFSSEFALHEFEVLAINDGSIDNSLAIVKKFSLQYPNIRIVDKLNEGVAKTRNLGLALATGDYVTFVDADDVIDASCFDAFYEKIKKEKTLDILISRMFVDKKESYPWKNKVCENIKYTGTDTFIKKAGRGSSCAVLYRLNFLKNNRIEFYPIRNSEDTLFYNECLLYAKEVSFIDVCFYYVTIRKNSASRDYDESRLLDYRRGLKYISELRNRKSWDPTSQCLIDCLQYSFISNVTYMALKYSVGYNEIYNIVKGYTCIGRCRSIKMKILNKSYFMFYMLCWVKFKII